MKTVFTIGIACMLMLSCNGGKPSQPDDLISSDKMEALLYDLHIIAAAKGINKKTFNNSGIQPEDYVLKKHQIDSAQFVSSNSYYAFYPETYTIIVENVKARLEKDKSVFEALQVIEDSLKKQEKDSLKALNKKKLSIDSIFKIKKKKLKRSLPVS